MGLILDTDILVDYLRGLPPALSFISEQDDINITSLSALELVNGCKSKGDLKDINAFLDCVSIYYANEGSQKISLEIFNKYRLSHGIGLVDALIAGIAIDHGLVLATRNIKHFEFIEGLKIILPY